METDDKDTVARLEGQGLAERSGGGAGALPFGRLRTLSEPVAQRAVGALSTAIPTDLRPLRTRPSPAPTMPKDQSRLVSVVVPCFNYGHFLFESVGSALAQRGVKVEVVIVDDASTDDSAQVAQAVVDSDSRVRLVRHGSNAGHVRAFNTGYAEVSGEFVVRLDADDLLTPGSLARAVALFEAFPGVGLVYGHPRHFTSSVPSPFLGDGGWTVWHGADWIAERCRRGVNCITTPEAMLRSSVLREVGPLREELRFAQDMEMWLRVAAVSDVGHVDGPDQALHRDHESSMSATVGSGAIVDLVERRTVFQLLFDRMGPRLADGERMRATAMSVLASEALERSSRAYDRGRTATQPVDEFVDFAAETFPDYTQLRAWRALQQRRRLGPTLSARWPPFLAAAVARRAGEELRYARWVARGV